MPEVQSVLQIGMYVGTQVEQIITIVGSQIPTYFTKVRYQLNEGKYLLCLVPRQVHRIGRGRATIDKKLVLYRRYFDSTTRIPRLSLEYLGKTDSKYLPRYLTYTQKLYYLLSLSTLQYLGRLKYLVYLPINNYKCLWIPRQVLK